MLGQRQRLWVNIEALLGEFHFFAYVLAQSIQQTQCWIIAGWVGRPASSVRVTSALMAHLYRLQVRIQKNI